MSIVRPSIIESALAEPFPGWIRGFRMAEPIIIGFARGLLNDFPGSPENVVDVIPVDIVVAAIGVCATDPSTTKCGRATSPRPRPTRSAWGPATTGAPTSSGDHPLYDDFDQPIPPPRWTFPTARQGQNRARTGPRRRSKAADRVMRQLPVRGNRAMIAADLEERREQVEQALTYVDLYGKYVVCEALFKVDNLLEPGDRLDDADRAEFDFDPSVVDWHRYVHRDPHARRSAQGGSRPLRRASAATPIDRPGPAAATRCSTSADRWRPSTSRTP